MSAACMCVQVYSTSLISESEVWKWESASQSAVHRGEKMVGKGNKSDRNGAFVPLWVLSCLCTFWESARPFFSQSFSNGSLWQKETVTANCCHKPLQKFESNRPKQHGVSRLYEFFQKKLYLSKTKRTILIKSKFAKLSAAGSLFSIAKKLSLNNMYQNLSAYLFILVKYLFLIVKQLKKLQL